MKFDLDVNKIYEFGQDFYKPDLNLSFFKTLNFEIRTQIRFK